MINKVRLYTTPAWNIHTLQDVLPIAIFNLHNLVYTQKKTTSLDTECYTDMTIIAYNITIFLPEA